MANKKTKMPPATVDEQFKFLISCIRYSNNGKVDFTEVANECNIISKGAAAKRYERMMKQHGLHQSASFARDSAPTPSPAKEPKTPTSTSAKKRKLAADNNNNDDDQEEAYHRVKDESDAIVKDEISSGGDAVVVKDEPRAERVMPPSSSRIVHYQDAGNVKEEFGGVPNNADERMFSEFLQSTAFEQQQQHQNGGGSAYAAAEGESPV